MGKLLHLTFSCLALGLALPMQAKVINQQQARAIAAKFKARETMRFDTLGQRIAKPAKGINIVRMSDGTVRKTFVK